jgi:hypothetical protein
MLLTSPRLVVVEQTRAKMVALEVELEDLMELPRCLPDLELPVKGLTAEYHLLMVELVVAVERAQPEMLPHH